MTPTPDPLPPFPTLRAALRLTAVAAVATLVALAGLLMIDRADLVAGMLAAAGVCLLASVASLDVMRRSVSGHLQRVVLAAMVSFPLRLALVGAGAALAGVALGGPVLPLVLWTLAFYLLLLAVEVRIVVGYIRGATAASPLPPTVKGSPAHA